jgi:hypothetical protein
MDLLYLLDVLFSARDFLKEYLMNDYAGLAALILVAGGVVFWLFALIAVMVGVSRGVWWVFNLARAIVSRTRGFNPAK